MTVKLKDIAEKAGVSVSTASNALNGYTKSRIAAETLERVSRIANEMGYRPNAIARSLKFQRTDTVAFYTGYGYCDVRDRFLGEIVTGVQNACDDCGIDLLLFGNLTKRPVSEIHWKLTSGKVDGIVVHAAADDPVVKLLAEGSLPAIAIADLQPNLPSIVADDSQGMGLLVDYLWSQGHRRIAFAGANRTFASVELRQAAFIDHVTRKGGTPVMINVPWDNTREYLLDFMAQPDRPTAIACWHDDIAYFLLSWCIAAGIRIPEDLAVVGFDGLQEGRIPGKHLVTVAAPWRLMAVEAATNLVKLRDGQPVEPLVRYPVTLIPGDTA